MNPVNAIPGTVAISGNKTLGSVLTPTTASWGSGSTFTYQWLRNGSPISGATGSTYTVVQADSGATITVTATASRTGYTQVSATSGAHVIYVIATQARILSTSVTRDSVTVNLDAVTGVSYAFSVYSPTNTLVKSFTCTTNCGAQTITGLASSTQWRIDIVATAPGGSAPAASTTATTYATLTLVPNIVEKYRTGDEMTMIMTYQAGWSYRLRTTSTCGAPSAHSGWRATTTLVVLSTISNNCYFYVEAMDGYGNTGASGSFQFPTRPIDPPTFRSAGSNVTVTTVQPGGLVPYNIDVYALMTIAVEVTLYNSSGQLVALPSVNRPSLASGTVWDGRYPGSMLLPSSLAYGTYEVRAKATAGGKSTTYVLGMISYPDPNPPVATQSPTVPISTSPTVSPTTSESSTVSPEPSPSASSSSELVTVSSIVTPLDPPRLGGIAAGPGLLTLALYLLLSRGHERWLFGRFRRKSE